MTRAARPSEVVRFKFHPFISLKMGAWSAEPGKRPKAPRGWRWLGVGEQVRLGDLCCDPRSNPVVVEHAENLHLWVMTPQHHPVLRRVPS